MHGGNVSRFETNRKAASLEVICLNAIPDSSVLSTKTNQRGSQDGDLLTPMVSGSRWMATSPFNDRVASLADSWGKYRAASGSSFMGTGKPQACRREPEREKYVQSSERYANPFSDKHRAKVDFPTPEAPARSSP
jgi:hypothetical protein